MSASLNLTPSYMADYLKLFHAKRLTSAEPHHLEYIKGRLAAMRVEDPKGYEEFSAHYGVTVTELKAEKVKVEDTVTGSVKVDLKTKKVSKK